MKKMKFPTRVAALFLFVSVFTLLTSSAWATEVGLQVSQRDEVAKIGKNLFLDIVIELPAGTTLAQEGLSIVATTSDGEPLLEKAYNLEISTPAEQHQNGARLGFVAPINSKVLPATRAVTLTLSGVTGDGSPATGQWTGDVVVDFGDDWDSDRVTAFFDSKGLPLFLLAVFGFGLLMSLSPCIYPMIPITLAVIGAQSQDKGALHGLKMSVTYVVGMAFVYAILGVLSATVFSGITAFMQSPTVLIPIAVLLVGLSFSMFGAYELQAPQFMRDKLQGPGTGGTGMVGVFMMGLVAGLVASPCVGPFLGGLLLWVATTGNWVLGFFSLFIFGLGMGMILIGVGTFPALISSMPQSGGWMDDIKKSMGLLLVAMAFYFVRPGSVLPEGIFYSLVGITCIITAIFFGAFDSMTSGAHWYERTRKGLGLVVFIVGLYFLGGTLLTHGFMMPSPLAADREIAVQVQQVAVPETQGLTKSTKTVSTTTTDSPGTDALLPVEVPHKVQWEIVKSGTNVGAFLEGKRAEAMASGKPIMIDFWAEWCVYCKKLDKKVWNQPEVVKESARFVTLKIDATITDDADMAAVKEMFQVTGLPTVAFIDSRGQILQGQKIGGFKDHESMLKIMQDIR
jgi:thioredoxin:protein disulfide reductase